MDQPYPYIIEKTSEKWSVDFSESSYSIEQKVAGIVRNGYKSKIIIKGCSSFLDFIAPNDLQPTSTAMGFSAMFTFQLYIISRGKH